MSATEPSANRSKSSRTMSNEGDAGEQDGSPRGLYNASVGIDNSMDDGTGTPELSRVQSTTNYGRASMVNMTDILDTGTAMQKEKNMRKIKERMRGLTRTLYNPDSDPQFYLFLNRLADAEEFKKTDRIDGRRALDDFIVDKKSIMYVKSVKQAD